MSSPTDSTLVTLRKAARFGGDHPGASSLRTVACPGSSFVTRVDVGTANSGDLPVRQWIKGLRVFCSNDSSRSAGLLNWGSTPGFFNDSADGPTVADGIKDVVVGSGAVIDQFGYSNFFKGSAIASWRQSEAKNLTGCVLSEVGGTAGDWLFSLNLGFTCPDLPPTTTSTSSSTATPTPTTTTTSAPQATGSNGGLGVGGIVGIMAGIAVLLAVIVLFVLRNRQGRRNGLKPSMAPFEANQGPTSTAAQPPMLGVSQQQVAGPRQGLADAHQPQHARLEAWKPVDQTVAQHPHPVQQVQVHGQFQAQHGQARQEDLFLAPPPIQSRK